MHLKVAKKCCFFTGFPTLLYLRLRQQELLFEVGPVLTGRGFCCLLNIQIWIKLKKGNNKKVIPFIIFFFAKEIYWIGRMLKGHLVLKFVDHMFLVK